AAELHINGNLTINNSATLFLNIGYSNPASEIWFTGSTNRTIGGNGTINSETDDNNSLIINDTQNAGEGQTLTIASGFNLKGGDATIYSTHSGPIVNNGSFDVVFWSFGNYDSSIVNGPFINNGTIVLHDYTTTFELHNQPGGTITCADGTNYFYSHWHND